MRVTENLKRKIALAQKKGYTTLVVTKTKQWGFEAIVSIDFNDILTAPTGIEYVTGKIGTFVSRTHPFPEHGIKYFDLMHLKEDG